MADKRISQLIERVDIANNDVLPIVASGATTTNKVTISTIQDWMQDNLDVGVTSVGITLGTSGNDVNVTGSPITTSGNITINIPTATATIRGVLSPTDWSTFNNKVPYTGATGNVNLGEYGISSGFVTLDTTPTGTPASQGTIYWDDSRSTAALIMNGTTQHIGQDSFFYVKNSTGYTIPKGTGVGFAGTDGASGHLLIQPFLANGSQPSTYFMGVTAEAITNGGFGQVMQFGELSGVNTSGYSAGALLYASTSVAGAFQTTAPQAPNNIILVAAAVNSTNNGSIIVRPQIGSNIKNDEGVKITSVADKDLLQYKSSTGLWENTSFASLGYVPYTGANAGVNLGTNPLSASQININGASPTGGSYLGFKHSTSVTTGTDGYTSIYTFGTNNIGFQSVSGTNIKDFTLSMVNITPNVPGGRVYNLPDASGTLALTSDLSSYLPLSGGTLTGALNVTNANVNLSNAYYYSGKLVSGTNIALIGMNASDKVSLDPNGYGVVVGNTLSLGGALNGTSASFTGTSASPVLTLANSSGGTKADFTITENSGLVVNSYESTSGRSIDLKVAGTSALTIASTGAATFSSSVNVGGTSSNTDFRIYRTVDAGAYISISAPGGSPLTSIIGISGTNVMSLNQSGNVGIGTTSPSVRLQVQDSANTYVSHFSGLNQTNGIALGTNSSNVAIIQGYTRTFSTTNNIAMQVDGGSISIGATSTNGRLGVRGTTNDSSAYAFEAANSSGNTLFIVRNDGNVGINTVPGARFEVKQGGSEIPMIIDSSSDSFGAYTQYQVNNSGGWEVGMARAADSYSYLFSYGSFGTANAKVTITNGGNVTIVGSLSKGSGSFKIDHPLPDKKDTHHLVHSFVEAPQADNIYRGKIDLVDGYAEVNIDEVSGMSEGTFVLLNGNIQCFTSNEEGWTAIRGKVEGNILKIEAQDSKCTDTISWLVIGERIDQHMIDTDWTDENGKVIVEPLKEVKVEKEEAEIEALKSQING